MRTFAVYLVHRRFRDIVLRAYVPGSRRPRWRMRYCATVQARNRHEAVLLVFRCGWKRTLPFGERRA